MMDVDTVLDIVDELEIPRGASNPAPTLFSEED